MDSGLGDGDVSNGAFRPALKPGEMPNQSDLKVSAWTCNDVSKWLQSISLGQYRTTFTDAAVDGEFLFDINDDDLKNTLGVEHRLHRKKIMKTVERLKAAQDTRDREAALSAYADQHPPMGFNVSLRQRSEPAPPQTTSNKHYLLKFSITQSAAMGYPGGPMGANGPFNPAAGVTGFAGVPPGYAMPGAMVVPGAMGVAEEGSSVFEGAGAIALNIRDMASWVRHNKYKKLAKALEQMAPRKFEKTYIKVQFVEDFGTQYIDTYEREAFHLNQPVEHGNTIMHIASQNGSLKIAKLLQRYGSNVDHQNEAGQSPGHFALAYTFYDFSSWLFDPDGGGADDTLMNIFHLGPYDGLQGEDQDSKEVVQAIEN